MSFQPFDLSGRVVLITGGNGGIGLGMAQGLAQAGAEVCIWGTNADKNAHALEVLSAIGPKITAQVCDVAEEAAVSASFAQVLADHGRVDGCFANAGIGGRGTAFDDMTKEEWDHIIGVNQTGGSTPFVPPQSTCVSVLKVVMRLDDWSVPPVWRLFPDKPVVNTMPRPRAAWCL